MTARAIVLGGTSSGVGKTTVAAGVAAALRRRGYRAQTFKVGPDYIDPGYLAAASGLPCRNLDTWMLPRDAALELFLRASHGKDFAIIEGVMGLFDGHSPEGEAGSTAEVAKLLGAPVVLVADASKVGRSIAATVAGFRAFDPALDVAGVVLTGIAGEGHLAHARGPIQQAAGLPVLGYLPHREELRLPERHLGLVPTAEGKLDAEFLDRLAHQVEQTIDLDGLLRLARPVAIAPPQGPSLFPAAPVPRGAAIAVALDAAFNFYYQDSLDLLVAWGAEMVPFSPLADSRLPPGVAGVYMGGGFPELFAEGLASNQAMKEALRQAAASGMPIYGECGGLMYLGQRLTDSEGRAHDMVGLVPACSSMGQARLTLGYRTVRALSDGPLLRRGEAVRGHEFHWSVLADGPAGQQAAYAVLDQPGRLEGFRAGNVLASYIHLHLGARPGLASAFVQSCQRWARRSLASP